MKFTVPPPTTVPPTNPIGARPLSPFGGWPVILGLPLLVLACQGEVIDLVTIDDDCPELAPIPGLTDYAPTVGVGDTRLCLGAGLSPRGADGLPLAYRWDIGPMDTVVQPDEPAAQVMSQSSGEDPIDITGSYAVDEDCPVFRLPRAGRYLVVLTLKDARGVPSCDTKAARAILTARVTNGDTDAEADREGTDPEGSEETP